MIKSDERSHSRDDCRRLLAAHFDKALILFSVLFLISLGAAIWVWRGKGIDGP